MFLSSRREGLSKRTIEFYKVYLTNFFKKVIKSPEDVKPEDIRLFLATHRCSLGGKHAYYRALRAFFNFLAEEYRIENPIKAIPPPKLPKRILPHLSIDQIHLLIDTADNIRDKCLISLLADSGARLSEIAKIKRGDIDFDSQLIKIIGKGDKERYIPFGKKTKEFLLEHLSSPLQNTNIWNLNSWGIISVLRRLEKKTGLPCNPHTFRRSFALILRQRGLPDGIIKELGGWESLDMVMRYTRAFGQKDALPFYKEIV